VLSRILALMQKEFIHILRDPRTLGLVLLMPVAQLVLFGYAINTTVEHLPTVVLDQADDRLSRGFVQSLVNSHIFDVVGHAVDPSAIRREVDSGNAKVGVILPPDFARNLEGGRTASVQVLVDGSDPNTSQAALFATVALGQAQAANALAARLNQAGLGGAGPTVDVRPVVLYNPSMESINFMIPSLIGLILQLQTLILTALAIVRERERGTLEQLIVTPIRSTELMLGKLLPYVVIAFTNVSIALAVGVFWFKVELAGSVWLLLALSVVFLFSTLGLGLLISTVSQTQGQATQLAIFYMLPSMLLTGFVFPRETMPLPLHDLGYLVPLTYYLLILRGIILKGIGLDLLWQYIYPMAALGIFLLGVSVSRFRKQLG
jgi:ABC-2 type transport system permease protein